VKQSTKPQQPLQPSTQDEAAIVDASDILNKAKAFTDEAALAAKPPRLRPWIRSKKKIVIKKTACCGCNVGCRVDSHADCEHCGPNPTCNVCAEGLNGSED